MPDLNTDPEPIERTVGEIGEDRLVSSVISRYPGADWLRVGPGDDAAVLDLAGRFPGLLVVGTDTLVEGQDFRRDWSRAFDVGVKTAAQNFADIAAMGAQPHTLLVSLTTPGDVPAAWARELADGLIDECTRAGAVVAGGDLSAGAELSITGTALGALSAPQAVLRSGARPGDVLAIAGVSGRSAAGWALLGLGHGVLGGAELPAGLGELVDDHRRPRPPYPAGPDAARAGATAMIDTSDGLVRDAERLARASGVVLDLDPQELLPDADLIRAAEFLAEHGPAGDRAQAGSAKPWTGRATSAGGPSAAKASSPFEVGLDPLEWVLSGGEDHALLACFPPEVSLPNGFRRIGRVLPVAAEGARVLLAGAPVTGSGGWRHFA